MSFPVLREKFANRNDQIINRGIELYKYITKGWGKGRYKTDRANNYDQNLRSYSKHKYIHKIEVRFLYQVNNGQQGLKL